MGDIRLPAGVVLALTASTFYWWASRGKKDVRKWSDYIQDIRAMNQYNAYLIAAIVIFLGFALSDTPIPIAPPALRMLLIAFTSGSVAMLFFPVRKPSRDQDVGLPVRAYWLVDILGSQVTVVFTVFGIWAIISEI
jgi:hypothetical protein